MGRLEELEKELYQERGEAEIAKRLKKRGVLPRILRKVPFAWGEEEPKVTVGKKKIDRRVLNILFGVAMFLVAIGIAAFTFFFLGTRAKELTLEMAPRKNVEAGEVVTIPLSMKNISRETLRDLELVLTLPPDALIREDGGESPAPPRFSKKLDDLEPGNTNTIEIETRFFGSEGEEKNIEAVVLYRPENLRARFSAKTQGTVRLSRVPLGVTVSVPEMLSRGQETEVAVRYTSSAYLPFYDVSLRLEYPPGFTFTSASPPPQSENNVWNLGTVAPGASGEILIRGTIAGEEGEIKPFHAALGIISPAKEWKQYTETSIETRLAVTPLSVEGFLGGSRTAIVNPGEKLTFAIRYRNNTAATIKNVTVRAFLGEVFGGLKEALEKRVMVSGERLLNFRTISIERGGVYDASSRGIVWGPGGTPELREIKPGAEGEFLFTIETRSRPIMKDESEKDLSIIVRSRIEAGDIPEALSGTALTSEDVLAVNVASRVIFSTKLLYYGSMLPTSGPLPPKVGAKTVYTVLWEIRNFTSDLSGVEARASLPPNVSWENVFSPKDADVMFDSVSSEVRWRIGKINAGTGVISSARSAAFQISVTPAEADIKKAMKVLNDVILLGHDNFINVDIKERIGAFSTELRDDPLSRPYEWVVVP